RSRRAPASRSRSGRRRGRAARRPAAGRGGGASSSPGSRLTRPACYRDPTGGRGAPSPAARTARMRAGRARPPRAGHTSLYPGVRVSPTRFLVAALAASLVLAPLSRSVAQEEGVARLIVLRVPADELQRLSAAIDLDLAAVRPDGGFEIVAR